MLRLVEHPRHALLVSSHLRIRIIRVLPVVVRRRPPGPLPIKGAHRSRIRGVHAHRVGQAFHVFPVAFAREAMVERARRRIGLEHRRVDLQSLALVQFLLLEGPQHHGEDLPIHGRRQPLPDDGKARMMRRLLRHLVVEEGADRKRVSTPDRARAFALQILEEAYHQHLEVDLWIDAGLSTLARAHLVERSGDAPDLVSELAIRQHPVQLLVESVRGQRRQIAGRDPEARRFLGRFLPKHGGVRRKRRRSLVTPPK